MQCIGLPARRRRPHERPARLCAPLQENNVIIYADTFAYASLQGHYPAQLLKEATEEDFGTEFLDYKMAVKVVEGIDSAIAHIQQYGSKHSECIVTEDKGHATGSAAKWMRPASTSMPRLPLQTEHSSDWVRRLASAHKSYMHADQWL